MHHGRYVGSLLCGLEGMRPSRRGILGLGVGMLVLVYILARASAVGSEENCIRR